MSISASVEVKVVVALTPGFTWQMMWIIEEV
jgi:hypothetical protein